MNAIQSLLVAGLDAILNGWIKASWSGPSQLKAKALP